MNKADEYKIFNFLDRNDFDVRLWTVWELDYKADGKRFSIQDNFENCMKIINSIPVENVEWFDLYSYPEFVDDFLKKFDDRAVIDEFRRFFISDEDFNKYIEEA